MCQFEDSAEVATEIVAVAAAVVVAAAAVVERCH